MIAPDKPVYAAVIAVATIRQHMARTIVLVCDSVNVSFVVNSNQSIYKYYVNGVIQ